MWLAAEHTTAFDYDGPIVEAYTELRLRPLDAGGQRCTSFRLTTDPPRVHVREYVDHFGNDVRHFDILESHDRLLVAASSEVLTPERLIDPKPLSLLEEHDYLMPTAHAPAGDAVRQLASDARADGTPAERAHALMEAVRGRLAYEPGTTDVHTTGEDALTAGRGVCQDFAHVLIAACRLDGIPARYVSGYIYEPEREGEDAASHAWVDVFDPDRGWVSLDPTHAQEQTEIYVRVAVGRDYGDVPPSRGVYRGGAEEQLSVRVSLRSLDYPINL
jgi:transglutaminase-like putative cysteine protease